MPSLLISVEGGVTTVAPILATPEMLQDGEQFQTPQEAIEVAGALLTEETDTPPQGADAPADPTAQAPDQGGGGEVDALMQEGFDRARKGR